MLLLATILVTLTGSSIADAVPLTLNANYRSYTIAGYGDDDCTGHRVPLNIGHYKASDFQNMGIRSVFVRGGDVNIDLVWVHLPTDLNKETDLFSQSISARSLINGTVCVNLELWSKEILVIAKAVNRSQELGPNDEDILPFAVMTHIVDIEMLPLRITDLKIIPLNKPTDCKNVNAVYVSRGRELMVRLVDGTVLHFPAQAKMTIRPVDKFCSVFGTTLLLL
jgi:hypothetical protein